MTTTHTSALTERVFDPLPLGAVTPTGWLRRQLRIQADGITGHLDERWPSLADNQWLGGEHGGWERGPYYADGLVPLAALLDDDDLRGKAKTWVTAFLETQDEDGWIGPVRQATHQGYDYDPWPLFVVLKVLSQYYEVTGDEAVIDTMVGFCRCLDERLDANPLENWARFRWQDLVLSIHWLYEHTDEDWLLDLAGTVTEQGYDWNAHFESVNRFDYADPSDDWTLDSHVVNHAMGVKAPGVRFRGSNAADDRETTYRALEILDRYHGQVTGTFSGDECLAGKSPTRGSELCSVVEFMFSLEHLVSVFGDPAFADRLERVAYNALPATFTADMTAHQYDQQVNQVLCTVADREWTNGPDANIFGLGPNFGCCTANLHQGWPKFASSLWMRTDDGLAAVAYAPCEVTTTVNGASVSITETTAYPFGDTIELTVEPDEPIAFSLTLRIPSWVEDATLTLPDGDEHRPESGTFHTVEREWQPGDAVMLDIPAQVEAERRYHGAVSLRRGPLVYSLPIEAKWQGIGGTHPQEDREAYPLESWNYGLHVDTDDPTASIGVDGGEPGETPFAPDDPPVELTVEGQEIPEWGIEQSVAAPVPRSPVRSPADREELTLIPYGCTSLRVTEFPLLGE